MKRYYQDPAENAAFERCLDVLQNMLIKYGHDALMAEKQSWKIPTHLIQYNNRAATCRRLNRYRESVKADKNSIESKIHIA